MPLIDAVCGRACGRILMRLMTGLAIALGAASCSTSEPFRRRARVDIDERALNIWQAIRLNDPVQMARDFDPRVDKAFPRRERAIFLEGVREKFGRPEEMPFPRRLKTFEGVYRLRFEKGELEMRLAVNEGFSVIGLTIGPPRKPEFARNKTPLAFPIEGAALVLSPLPDLSDGAAFGENDPQRFAMDLVATDSTGRTRAAVPKKVSASFPCFGRKVLAPAAGVITEAVDGVRDNLPGESNATNFLGNAVAIEHGPGETSVVAHLKNGSLRVKQGQKVKRGQWIAQCGSSGGTTEPRLRYFMQDQPRLAQGKPLIAKFDGVIRHSTKQLEETGASEIPDRVAMSRSPERLEGYLPSRGDVVEAPPASSPRRAMGK